MSGMTTQLITCRRQKSCRNSKKDGIWDMRIVKSCEECLYGKQEARVKNMEDKEKCRAFLTDVRNLLDSRQEEDTAPYMVYKFNQAFSQYFGDFKSYREIRKEYNDLVLAMEARLEEKINASDDPLKTALLYSRVGNYIDFGAMNHVDKDTFLSLFDQDSLTEADCAVYQSLLEKCRQGQSFLLLCDNCGEIVLDKLFIRQLKKRFPHLRFYAMVRGQEVLNDATVKDALYCGMDGEAEVISNGNAVAGTVIRLLDEKAKRLLDEADVIFSKGQGNYETISGCGRNIFYSFLCKCDYFSSRFHVPRLTGMLIEE